MQNFNEYTLTFKAHIAVKDGEVINWDGVHEYLTKRLVIASAEKMLIGATKIEVEKFK